MYISVGTMSRRDSYDSLGNLSILDFDFDEILDSIVSRVRRPTTSSSRKALLGTKSRKELEETNKENMKEFSDQPYMNRDYPELSKHYPGTWRVGSATDVRALVSRLATPTVASRARSANIHNEKRQWQHKDR